MTTAALGILLGAGFGLIVGTTVAGVTAVLGFASRYYTDRQLPKRVVVSVTLFVGAFHAVIVATFTPSVDIVWLDRTAFRLSAVQDWVPVVIEYAPGFAIFGIVTTLLGLYGHRQGERIAGDVPVTEDRRTDSRETLSPETVAAADATNRVSLDVTHGSDAFVGRASLSPEEWTDIESRTWKFRADLPIDELEVRLAARLRMVFGVNVTAVTIDRRGQATVTAEPGSETIAGQLSDGQRAVTIETLVPAGLESGDHVTLAVENTAVDGTVLGIGSTQNPARRRLSRGGVTPNDTAAASSTGQAHDSAPAIEQPDRAVVGGERRLSVAVDVDAVSTVLTAETVDLRVRSRGGNQSLGAFRQLHRTGAIVRRVTIDEENHGSLVEHADDIEVLARRPPDAPDGWQFRSVEGFARSGDPDSVSSRREGDGEPSDTAGAPQQSDGDRTVDATETAFPPGTDVFVIGSERLMARFTADEPPRTTVEKQ